MQNKIAILTALLVLQVALAAGLTLRGGDFGARATGEPLLAFERSAVQELTLTGGDGRSVTVARGEDGWRLPQHHGFPAAGGKVKRLLATLEGLAPALPVATSSEAAERFRVAEASFERRIDLRDGDGNRLAHLYVGDSPGARRAYVRAADDAAVYEAAIDRATLGTGPGDWTDPVALRRDAATLSKIETGDVTLVRDDEGAWRLRGLADGQTTDREAARMLIDRLTFLQYDRVLGKVGDAPAGGETAATVTFTPKEGAPVMSMDGRYAGAPGGSAPVEYRLRKNGEDGYTLTASDQPWRFALTKLQAEALLGIDRNDLWKES